MNETSNFKATALTEEALRRQAPSVYATGPMAGLSARYAFVPTARIVDGLGEHGWVPVAAEEGSRSTCSGSGSRCRWKRSTSGTWN